MTASQAQAELARVLRAAGASISDPVRHQAKGVLQQVYAEVGYNYRMTDIQAAIGLVQLERLPEMLEIYRSGFESRGLEFAIWGHLSDGNLHPNVLPRDSDEVARGFDAQLEFAERAIRLGGCPLSEHGVGRNPFKQKILRRFVGAPALRTMRRIKRALDPGRRLSPGVLLPAV